LPPTPVIPEVKKFFGHSNDDDILTVLFHTTSAFRIKKEEAAIGKQLENINERLNSDVVGFAFTRIYDKGQGVKIIKIHFTDKYKHSIMIPQNLADALGFDQFSFQPGEYISKRAPNEELFRQIPQDYLFTFRLYRWIENKVKIPEPETYSYDMLIMQIAMELTLAKYAIGFEEEGNLLKVKISDMHLRLKFPSQINTYLGLKSDFVFTEPETDVYVPDDILPSSGGEVNLKTSLFTYVQCDLVENQFFGSTSKPILRLIPKSMNKVEQHIFDLVYYLEPRVKDV